MPRKGHTAPLKPASPAAVPPGIAQHLGQTGVALDEVARHGSNRQQQ